MLQLIPTKWRERRASSQKPNRRRHQRFSGTGLPITLIRGKHAIAIKDISLGGLQAVFPDKIPLGSLIRVQLNFCGLEQTVISRCVQTRKKQLHLRFHQPIDGPIGAVLRYWEKGIRTPCKIKRKERHFKMTFKIEDMGLLELELDQGLQAAQIRVAYKGHIYGLTMKKGNVSRVFWHQPHGESLQDNPYLRHRIMHSITTSLALCRPGFERHLDPLLHALTKEQAQQSYHRPMFAGLPLTA